MIGTNTRNSIGSVSNRLAVDFKKGPVKFNELGGHSRRTLNPIKPSQLIAADFNSTKDASINNSPMLLTRKHKYEAAASSNFSHRDSVTVASHGGAHVL